jgi:acyl-CoA thioester hydrolase
MARPYAHSVRIRYSECDQQDVLFNGHYLFLYDVALTELWREAVGRWHHMIEEHGADLVVAEARLRYLAPVRFDDVLEIEMPIAKLGTTSMTVAPTYRVGGTICAEGEVRHVFIDPETKGKREIPADVRARLEPYAVTESPR